MTFEQAVEDLQKLYHLLVHGEPTPDEETESKDKILAYLKDIQQSPEGDRVKDLVQQAITLASGWDVYDLWFKEVKELPSIVEKILTTIKPVPAAHAEKPAEKVEPSVAGAEKTPSETPSASVAGSDIEAIVAKVADQFKSQIQELKGKISDLEKNLDEKDHEIEKTKHPSSKGETPSGSGSDRPQLKPKLQVPKLKIPPVPPSKPLIPHMEETPAPAIPGPVEEAAPPQPAKPLAIKPIAIKPVIIEPSVVEKPAPVQPSIPKPVPVRQMIPKPISIKPLSVEATAEPAKLQPIPVSVAATRANAQGLVIKPVSVNVGPVEPPANTLEPIPPSNLQPISPRPISVKPISVAPVSPQKLVIKPVTAQQTSPTPISAQPMGIKPVSVQPVSVQPVGGVVRPVSVTPAGPVVIKPISAQPVGIKPISPISPVSPGANLASTLSSIGRSPQPAPESMISVRPIAAAPAPAAGGIDPNATLPESKTDLYSELIALEGRRFATERRKKELEDQREKGQLTQIEFQNSAGRADMDLQGIASRINLIRQKLSTL